QGRKTSKRQAESGNETAADTERAFGRGAGPDRLQIDSNRRKNRHVKNGEEIFGKRLAGVEFEGHTSEPQVEYFGTTRSRFAEDSVGVRAGHGNAFCFARHSVVWAGLDGRRSNRDVGLNSDRGS